MLAEDRYFIFVTGIMRSNVLSAISIFYSFGQLAIHQRQVAYLFAYMVTWYGVCIIIVFIGICSSSISCIVLDSSVGTFTSYVNIGCESL